MLTVQVSVRQTVYTSRAMSYRYKIMLHFYNSRIAIFGSISPPYEHFYAHTRTTMQQPIRTGKHQYVVPSDHTQQFNQSNISHIHATISYITFLKNRWKNRN